MPLKISSFKPSRGVIRKDFSRFWPVWAGYLFCLLLAYPVQLLQMKRSGFSQQPGEELARYLCFSSRVSATVLIALFAALAALTVWSYLHNARAASLYHSLPLTRESLFTSHWLAGMGFLVLPQLGTALLCGIIILPVLGFKSSLLFCGLWLLFHLFLDLLFFGLGTLIAMLTGNLMTHAILYGIFHFMFYICEQLVQMYQKMFLFGVSHLPARLTFLSPLVWLFTHFERKWDWESFSPSEDLLLLRIGCYALAGLVLSLAALLLYRKRQIESAGDVIAIRSLRPVAKYAFAFGCALVLGAFFLLVLFYGEESLPAVCVSMLLGGTIGYFVAAMLLKKSFRVFRWDWNGLKGWLCAVLALLVLIAGIRLDFTGISKRVPAADQVKEVRITCSGEGLTLSDPAKIEQTVRLHRQLLDVYAQQQNNLLESPNGVLFAQPGDAPLDYATVCHLSLEYTMQDGSELDRVYDLSLAERDQEPVKTVLSEITLLLSDPEAIAADRLPPEDASVLYFEIVSEDTTRFPLLNQDETEPPDPLSSYYDPPVYDSGYCRINPGDEKAVLQAMREDILAGELCTFQPLPGNVNSLLFAEIDWVQKEDSSDSASGHCWISITEADPASRTVALLQTLRYLKVVE